MREWQSRKSFVKYVNTIYYLRDGDAPKGMMIYVSRKDVVNCVLMFFLGRNFGIERARGKCMEAGKRNIGRSCVLPSSNMKLS